MDHLALLEREVDALTAALAEADLDAPVEACPGWTVRDLAGHVVGVHRWALQALLGTGPQPIDESLGDDPATTYAEAAAALVGALRALPPEAPVWTFDPSNPTAAFWRRRQLHEVAVHRWDVVPHALPEEVALDGVDEVMTFFAPRQAALGRTTFPAQRLVVRTGGREWALGEGPDVVVEGDPSTVLLRLWGRGAPRPEGWEQLTP